MGSFNRATLIGHLGRDAELRYTQAGEPVASVSLATTEKWKDKTTGAMKEQTEWHRIVIWGKTAENLAEFLTKGKLICVEGMIQTKDWTDKDGIKRKSTEIRANRVVLLGSKSNGAGDYKAAAPPTTATAASEDAEPVDDSDIPF